MRLLLVVVMLAGCPDRTISRVPSTENGVVTKKILARADLDVLFVIDNSSSTFDKQQLFANNFPAFVAALDTAASGHRPDLHLGVVSTSVGLRTGAFAAYGCPASNDDGLLQIAPRGACTTPPITTADRFLSDISNSSGGRATNYTGTLADALTCIALLGDKGCGFEAQLEAMKLALDGSQPRNAGFVRDGAYLAVVFLTDEDDCSVVENDPSLFERTDLPLDDFRCQPLYAYDCDAPISATGSGAYHGCVPHVGGYLEKVSRYYDFLTGVKDPSLLVVALVAGDPTADIAVGPLTINNQTQPLALQPSCSATILGKSAIARPALRLADFASRFGDRGLFRTVCQSDYSGVVTAITGALAAALSPCLEGSLDVSSGAPICTVDDVVGTARTPIVPCLLIAPDTPDPTGARPCWWVESNPAACPTATGLLLHVERAAPAAPGTVTEADCQVLPTP
jgi:hypothetical protein